MPPRQIKKRLAPSSSALRYDPDSVSDFLGDMSQPVGANAGEAAVIAVNLKSLQKKHETTILKALAELNREIALSSEEVLLPYMSPIVGAVVRHAEHSSALVRAGVFTLLGGIVQRGELLKQEVMKQLPSLAPAWVICMNDMVSSVQKEACNVFEKWCSQDLLRTHADHIIKSLIDTFEDVITQSQGKPLQDGALDRRSNSLYSCACAMGYMARLGSPAAHRIVTFVERGSLQPIMPPCNRRAKGSLVANAPMVRSASLKLLQGILSSRLATPQVHQVVSAALRNALLDNAAVVVRRCWELLLMWFGDASINAAQYIQEDFLSTVIESFTSRNKQPELAEVIYPSLVPLLVPITRDPRFSSAIEGVGDALMQKLSHSSDITQQEWHLVLSSLLQMWELRCVRAIKLGLKHEGDVAVMFSRIFASLVMAMVSTAQRARFFQTTVSAIVQGMIRIVRHEGCFNACLILLGGEVDSFPCVSSGAGGGQEESVLSVFSALQAAVIGSVMGLPGVPAIAERLLVRYANARLWGPLVELLRACIHDTKNTAASNGVGLPDSTYLPSVEARLCVTKCVLEVIHQVSSGEASGTAERPPTFSPVRDLIPLVLAWGDEETRQQLLQIGSATPHLQWLEETVLSHDLRDPRRSLSIFINACEGADFSTLELCVSAYDNVQNKQNVLSCEAKRKLRCAVQQSFSTMLQMVEDGEDMELSITSQSGSEDSDNSDSSFSGTSSNGDEDADFDEADAANHGPLIRERIISWSALLRKGERFASLLEFSGDDIDLPTLFRIVAAVAPRLHAEQYVSIKALRTALQEKGDPLLSAISKKKHALSVKAFDSLVEHVEALLDSHEVNIEERDTASLELFDDIMREPGNSIAACGNLPRLVPFASASLLQGIGCSRELWTDHSVLLRDQKCASESLYSEIPFAMFERYCSLGSICLTMLACVRTGQLIHLLSTTLPLDPASVLAVAPSLLRAARVQEVLSDSMKRVLMTKLLPCVLLSLSSQDKINTLLSEEEPHWLLCTLSAVIRDVLIHSCSDALMNNARLIASRVTQWIVETLLLKKGDAPVHGEAISAYRTFFATLDQAADIIGKSILSSLGADSPAVSALKEAMCILPSLDLQTALLVMTLHRHLDQMPLVRGNTVHHAIERAKRERALDGAQLLAELGSSRIIEADAYSELVRVLMHLLARSYRLRHMPPNNCLVNQAPDDPPISPRDMRFVAVAAVSARRGLALQGRTHDMLRSSVYLILFDVVAECTLSFQKASEQDIPLLARLVAFISDSLSDILTSDVSVLRASERTVVKVAAVMNCAYQWLCATPIARLDKIGMDTVANAVRAVALPSNLTLMRSSFVLSPIMERITGKGLFKNIRNEFTAQSPARAKLFTHHMMIIAKTNKQKLALFLYLLAWCITISGSAQESVSKERRKEVFHLLDLLCVLLLFPTCPGQRRLENTYLGSRSGGGKAGEGVQLGFETIALTRANSAEPMRELAKGAAAVFALLLQGNTLPLVKQWLETIERKLQDLFCSFVEVYLSPLLIRESLFTVLSKSNTGEPTFDISENYTVTVNVQRSRITLTYRMEDVVATLHITFPMAFPLHPPTVTSESLWGCGVSTERLRAWMLKMTVLLFGGTSNIWDCVGLFGRNMDEHFSGKEPCPICFAVVSASTNRLPDMHCAVCRNSAIHADCLHTWWASSGMTVCPLCRSPWVAS
ncbi:hypothetical protein ERJ75_001528400 [Trypanosoma vivax]|nr:hypothetical protein ERJ75_001528400 [Trypanosoma vivax]